MDAEPVATEDTQGQSSFSEPGKDQEAAGLIHAVEGNANGR